MATLSGSFELIGSMTASGDLKFTSTSSGIVQLINVITPTGTASFGNTFNDISTNTTTYLSYGINVVATSSISSASYCVRLPQTPQKGKNVTVINNDGVDLFVFPSTASGDINGVVDGYFTVPPDGRSYTFNCYENPLPGGWSSNTLPNGNIIYSSGVVTYNASSSNAFRLAFINNSTKLSGSGVVAGSIPASQNPSTLGTLGSNGGFVNAYYVPSTNWSKINTISILTNLTGSSNINFQLAAANYFTYYLAGTSTQTQSFPSSTTFNPIIQNWAAQVGLTGITSLNSNFFSGTNFYSGGTFSIIPGTFISSSGSPKLSTIVGGPGTKKITWNMDYTAIGSSIAKLIGKYYVGTGPNSQGVNIDAYYNHTFSPVFGVQNENLDGIKIKMNMSVTL